VVRRNCIERGIEVFRVDRKTWIALAVVPVLSGAMLLGCSTSKSDSSSSNGANASAVDGQVVFTQRESVYLQKIRSGTGSDWLPWASDTTLVLQGYAICKNLRENPGLRRDAVLYMLDPVPEVMASQGQWQVDAATQILC
jgi:hypothetical protein